MHLHELLNEGKKDDYKILLDVLPNVILSEQKKQSLINSAINDLTLMNHNAIVWFLKGCRAAIVNKLSDKTVVSNYINKQYKNDNNIISNNEEEFLNGGMLVKLKHYLSYSDKIYEIKTYQYGNTPYTTVINTFETLVNEFNTNQSNKIDMSDDTTSVKIISFPDGSAWFDLNKPSCTIEARAMGHCGNEGNPHDTDTVLSYRTPNSDGTWTPHLTFILDTKTNSLTEMKGRGNSKPIAKYHPYIIELLKSDYVEGIIGGGYKPQNNFSLSDLPENIQHQLITSKPKLLNLYELYIHNDGMIDKNFMEKFNDTVGVESFYIDEINGDFYLVSKQYSVSSNTLRHLEYSDNPVWNKYKYDFTTFSYTLYDEYIKSDNKLPDNIKEYVEYKDMQNVKDFGYKKTLSILLREYDSGLMPILKRQFIQTHLDFVFNNTSDDIQDSIKIKNKRIDMYINASNVFKDFPNKYFKSHEHFIREELDYIMLTHLKINITSKDLAKYMYNIFNCYDITEFLNDKTQWNN